MGYYVEEYRDGHIGVEQLVVALFELFNTHAKVKTKEVYLTNKKEGSKENQFSSCSTQLHSLYVFDCCEL